MPDTIQDPVLLAAARAVAEADAGRATIPAVVLENLRVAVANAAPHCTPEQIANGECPTA